MKIAVVLPPNYRFCAEFPNSIETVIRTFAARHAPEDQVVVVCEPGAKRRCDIPVIEIDSRGGGTRRNRDIIVALKAFDPDYLEFHQSAAKLRPVAKAFFDRATVFYRHNYFKRPKGLFGAFRLYWRMKYFRAVILVSEALRTEFLHQFPDYRGLTYAIPNAIDPAQWPGDSTAKDNVIMFSGRAAPEKGVAPLAEALAEVLPRHPQWRAVLILNEYKKHADWADGALSVLDDAASQVTILKDQKLDIVKDQVRHSAIAVIPSMWKEPFGLTALEAHSGGCAVISSGTGGLREVSGDYAVMLNEVTGADIAAALEDLIGHPEKRAALAHDGQAYALATHTTDVRAAQLDQVRREIVAAVSR